MTIVMIVDMILTLLSPRQLEFLLWDMLHAEILSIVNFTLNRAIEYSIVNFTLNRAIEYYLTFAMISTDKGFILIN